MRGRLAPAVSARDSVSGMSRGLVLVIEDDEWVSRLLQSAIREAGYDAVVCSTAKAGLEAAFSQHPDCIVCDIDLPDDDGFQTWSHLRIEGSQRWQRAPLLAVQGRWWALAPEQMVQGGPQSVDVHALICGFVEMLFGGRIAGREVRLRGCGK